MKSIYFGCMLGGKGHYFFDEKNHSIKDHQIDMPWDLSVVDGKLTPQGVQIEGIVKHHQKDGWTAIAFWDRSGDQRYGSHSTFFFDKLMNVKEAILQAKLSFPFMFARIKFPLTEEAP